MSESRVRLMVDTNVWIDAYCANHTGFDAANALIHVAEHNGVELFYTIHGLTDVLYVVEQEYRRQARGERGSVADHEARAIKEAALACMRNVMELGTAVGADGSDLWLADKYLPVHGDIEDNLVLAACRRACADYLVTNDRTLISHADVVAKTPEDMVRLFEVGQVRKQGSGFAPGEVSWRYRREAR